MVRPFLAPSAFVVTDLAAAHARWPETRDVGWRAAEGFGQPALGYPE
jgi:hypothetical protein